MAIVNNNNNVVMSHFSASISTTVSFSWKNENFHLTTFSYQHIRFTRLVIINFSIEWVLHKLPLYAISICIRLSFSTHSHFGDIIPFHLTASPCCIKASGVFWIFFTFLGDTQAIDVKFLMAKLKTLPKIDYSIRIVRWGERSWKFYVNQFYLNKHIRK